MKIKCGVSFILNNPINMISIELDIIIESVITIKEPNIVIETKIDIKNK